MSLKEEIETGKRCVECAEPLLDHAAPGYPRKCHRHGGPVAGPLSRMSKCPHCLKDVKSSAMASHVLVCHG